MAKTLVIVAGLNKTLCVKLPEAVEKKHPNHDFAFMPVNEISPKYTVEPINKYFKDLLLPLVKRHTYKFIQLIYVKHKDANCDVLLELFFPFASIRSIEPLSSEHYRNEELWSTAISKAVEYNIRAKQLRNNHVYLLPIKNFDEKINGFAFEAHLKAVYLGKEELNPTIANPFKFVKANSAKKEGYQDRKKRLFFYGNHKHGDLNNKSTDSAHYYLSGHYRFGYRYGAGHHYDVQIESDGNIDSDFFNGRTQEKVRIKASHVNIYLNDGLRHT